MPGEQLEHVVEKPDARADVVAALAVDVMAPRMSVSFEPQSNMRPALLLSTSSPSHLPFTGAPRRLRVGAQPFGVCQRDDGRTDPGQAGPGDTLHGRSASRSRPSTARRAPARCPPSEAHGSIPCVVAGRLRRPWTDENRAGGLTRAANRVVHTRCSARNAIDEVDRFLPRAATTTPPWAVIEEGAGPSAGMRFADLRVPRVRRASARRDQHGAGVGIVLGLGDEVGRDPVGRPPWRRR